MTCSSAMSASLAVSAPIQISRRLPQVAVARCALLCELPLTQAYSTDQRVAAQGLIEVNIAKPIDVTRPPNSIIEAENVAGVRIWVRSDFR